MAAEEFWHAAAAVVGMFAISRSTLRGIERADLALTDANAATLARLLGIGTDEYRAAHQRARERPVGTQV